MADNMTARCSNCMQTKSSDEFGRFSNGNRKRNCLHCSDVRRLRRRLNDRLDEHISDSPATTTNNDESHSRPLHQSRTSLPHRPNPVTAPFHHLQDERPSQTLVRRDTAAVSRRNRCRQRQIQRGITPSSSAHASNQLPQPTNIASLASQVRDDSSDSGPFAVSTTEWATVAAFNDELSEKILELCEVCDELWFDLKVRDGKCARCFNEISKNHQAGYVPRFGHENWMDPGKIPSFLPELTDTEQMLIARAHVVLQIHRVKGVQYKYAGHTCFFMQNTGKIYQRLPLLPSQLEIVLLKPPHRTGSEDEATETYFRRRHTVRRDCVQLWLQFLKAHNPVYRNVVIDNETLARLPTNGSVHHEFLARDEIQNANILGRQDLNQAETNDTARPTDEQAPPADESSCVPDQELTEHDRTELDILRADLAAHQNDTHPPNPRFSNVEPLSLPSIQSTPLNEFNDAQNLFTMVFPTLFPFGTADLNPPPGQHRRHTIHLDQWVRHLLKYKDMRFGKHNRFRYVAFNMSQRRTSQRQARWVSSAILKDSSGNFDEEAFRELLDSGDTQALADAIARSGQALKGSRPFWNKQRLLLEATVRDIGCPHLFFTFSAADMQWADLHLHMPSFESQQSRTSVERYRMRADDLAANPHIAAAWLHIRFKIFFDLVMRKKFSIADYWFRFEWQQRGSGHVHGFLWLNDCPTPSTSSEASRTALALFWERQIIATSSDPTNHSRLGQNPASHPFSIQENTVEALDECCRWFQRHSGCTRQYCLRKVRGTDQYRCRFDFPKPHREQARIERTANGRHWRFAACRNDAYLNNYVPLFTLGWRANTDATPCVNSHAVVDYIAKYASKSEEKSLAFYEIFNSVTQNLRGDASNPLQSAATKLLNALLAERDWSAQEVSHIVLGLPLVESSRDVVNLDLRPKEAQTIPLLISDGEVRQNGSTWLEKYERRMTFQATDDDATNVSLLEFTRQWEVRAERVRRRPRAIPRVVNIFPRYCGAQDSEQYEDYCRVKLMLHHPFICVDDLQQIDPDTGFASFSYALQCCLRSDHDHPHDPLDELEGENEITSEDELEPADEELDLGSQPGFAELARRLANREGALSLGQQDLGSRAIDASHDWHSSDVLFEQYAEALDFQNSLRLPNGEALPHFSEDSLNLSQRRVFDLLAGHYELLINGAAPKQLLLHVDGRAGTGKSHLIATLSSFMANRAQSRNLPDPVIRGAPTGIAAFGISGSTLHSILRLPSRTKTLSRLTGSILAHLQADWARCNYFIIDEKSMISLPSLSWIDQRLRQIMARPDVSFGGINVVLFGDFFQLAPVAGAPMYMQSFALSFERADLLAGQNLYGKFDKTMTLGQVMRQAGEDDESIAFRSALTELRDAGPDGITPAAYALLESRVKHNVPRDDLTEFVGAVHVLPTKNEVERHNLEQMRRSGLPVILINAKHNVDSAKRASEDDAQGLYAELRLSQGSRVMLTCNLATHWGLVNGTIGHVQDIVWRPDIDVHHELPLYVLMRLNNQYRGPCLFHTEGGEPVVPIKPVSRNWLSNQGQPLQRTMLPLVVADAITVHKSQGLTLNHAVMDLSRRDFATGLTYVAVSRVKSIRGILFKEPFGIERFKEKETLLRSQRRNDVLRRQSQIVQEDADLSLFY